MVQLRRENLKRSFAECHLAVVVVSSRLVDVISRRGGDAKSGVLVGEDWTASRRVYVSVDGGSGGESDGAGGEVGGRQVEAARRAFGGGVAVVALSDVDAAVERIRVEMTAAAASSTFARRQRRLFAPPEISQHDGDTGRQLMYAEKY